MIGLRGVCCEQKGPSSTSLKSKLDRNIVDLHQNHTGIYLAEIGSDVYKLVLLDLWATSIHSIKHVLNPATSAEYMRMKKIISTWLHYLATAMLNQWMLFVDIHWRSSWMFYYSVLAATYWKHLYCDQSSLILSTSFVLVDIVHAGLYGWTICMLRIW